MHPVRKPVVADAELVQIAAAWGWHNPSSEVLAVAAQARDAKRLKSAEFLVALGVVSPEQKERLLASKPNTVQTVAWFAQQDNISVPVERVFALMNDCAYYELLSQLSVHPSMQVADVIKQAEELDAVVMLIEGTVPVIVFSTFSALLKFRSLGRVERMQNAMLGAIGTEPRLAVGARDEISSVLKSVRSDEVGGSLESTNVWDAEGAEGKGQKESREIRRLIDHALTLGATDIALKPFRDGKMQVQLRKFGQMISPKAVNQMIPAELAGEVVRLLQAKSSANTTNTIQRLPTDGQITYRSAVGEAFLRLSFIPLNHLGELRHLTSVSTRLLPRTESSVSFADLHIDDEVVRQIRFAMRMSQGLVLVVGPTNSGKSTTVAGCIGEHVDLFGDSQKRLSIEDPIERFLYGITQINAPPVSIVKKGDEGRFGVILRAIKRHDPDVIFIGEVRDKETADLCVASASTGHLVLTTLHANHTIMGFDVLAKTVKEDMRFQLIEAMSMVISQRLVKVVCPTCRKIEAPTADDRDVFARYLDMLGETDGLVVLPDTVAHANPDGCEACAGDGYIGSVPINEVLPFTRKVKDAAIEMLNGENRRSVMTTAMPITLLKSAMKLLREHRIDLNDLLV